VSDWETVVGLEVHCELKTRTKLFCGCPNAFGDEPNTNVCPVCLGLPGSLPVLNERAVELAMRIGAALHCEIRPSVFHRKNYFYPDMPKDYQITQYDLPINVGGFLELPDGTRVGIVRAHLEEDTGKTTHLGGSGRIHDAERALVDYNRAGVPLVEIVSAPDLRSGEQARAYVAELRAILVGIGTVLADDPRLNVRPPGLRTPTRIILDSSARLPTSSQLVQTAREIPVWVAVTDRAPQDRRQALEVLGCEILALPGNGPIPVIPLLEELGSRGLTNLLVEGGGTVLGAFLGAGAVDEVDAYIAPLIEGGSHGFNPANGQGCATMAEALRLDRPEFFLVDGDLRIRGTLPAAWRA